MPENDDRRPPDTRSVLPFPQSRVKPLNTRRPYTDLGLSPLARNLGSPERQATGHWCSRCQGIWFGAMLEVACPRCGSRHG